MAKNDLEDLPQLSPDDPQEAVAWDLFKKRFGWYSNQATLTRWGYLGCRGAQLLLAASVTIGAAFRAASWVSASLGAAILVVEGVQQMLQFHANYLSFRMTTEALRNEAWLYAASAGPYGGDSHRRPQLFAEAITRITSSENAAWARAMSVDQKPASSPSG